MGGLWKEEATEVVLEFLAEASVGRRLSVARAPRAEEAGEDGRGRGVRGGRGRPGAALVCLDYGLSEGEEMLVARHFVRVTVLAPFLFSFSFFFFCHF